MDQSLDLVLCSVILPFSTVVKPDGCVCTGRGHFRAEVDGCFFCEGTVKVREMRPDLMTQC